MIYFFCKIVIIESLTIKYSNCKKNITVSQAKTHFFTKKLKTGTILSL